MSRRACAYCGTAFNSNPKGKKYDYCCATHAQRALELRNKIRVMVRDKHTCQLCDKPVDITLNATLPEGPTMDHKKPHSGKRSRETDPSALQLAHMACNQARGDVPLGKWNQFKELQRRLSPGVPVHPKPGRTGTGHPDAQ